MRTRLGICIEKENAVYTNDGAVFNHKRAWNPVT
jgi:hypothetical protein